MASASPAPCATSPHSSTEEWIRFSKHGSVHGLFNLHFGRTGILPADLTAFYNQLFEVRLAADYRGAFQFEEAQVRPWLSETRRFLAFIEQLLQAAPED